MNMKRAIQAILLVWFLAVNVAILVPSYILLFGSDDAGTMTQSQPPDPPPPPSFLAGVGPIDSTPQQVEVYKQQVAAYAEQIKGYTQEVTAYTQRVAAYKTFEEAREKGGRRGVYELVVKGSLITLLGGFATTLIAYVFANLGAGVVDNIIRLRGGRDPQPLTLL